MPKANRLRANRLMTLGLCAVLSLTAIGCWGRNKIAEAPSSEDNLPAETEPETPTTTPDPSPPPNPPNQALEEQEKP